MDKRKEINAADYASVVAEAEASVSAVKDPELKRVAFEKILMTLLERTQPRTESGKRAARATNTAHGNATKQRSTTPTRRGPKARIEALIDDGFFEQKRTIAEVKAELADQGHHIAITSLSGPLQTLTQDRKLRRQRITSDGKGSKATFAYSNW